MKRHVIIAPHADDEIIGCHAVLAAREVATVAFPLKNKGALKESIITQALFLFEAKLFSTFESVIDLATQAKGKNGYIFFPDPVNELHPDHRIIGGLGERLIKEQKFDNVIFYTTNMNAPYMEEAIQMEEKREALDRCYPRKKSLWEYDYKYFLFEGYTTWNLPKKLI